MGNVGSQRRQASLALEWASFGGSSRGSLIQEQIDMERRRYGDAKPAEIGRPYRTVKRPMIGTLRLRTVAKRALLNGPATALAGKSPSVQTPSPKAD